jgi:hypothetical protein
VGDEEMRLPGRLVCLLAERDLVVEGRRLDDFLDGFDIQGNHRALSGADLMLPGQRAKGARFFDE